MGSDIMYNNHTNNIKYSLSSLFFFILSIRYIKIILAISSMLNV